MEPLQSQLLRHEQQQLREFEALIDPQLSLHDYIARRWDYQGFMKATGVSDQQVADMIAEWGTQYAEWTPEQIRAGWSIHHLCENYGMMPLRRILREDPAELGVGRCLETRLHWLRRRLIEQSGIGIDEDDVGFIPMALGVRDLALARRLAEGPFVKRQSKANELMRQAVLAAFRKELDVLGSLAAKLGKGKFAPTKTIATCLSGIAEERPELVAAGLQDRFDYEARARKRKEGETICADLHDFYRLAEWVSAELVAGFDVTQPLPWDAGFHAWTQEHPDPLAGVDLRDISPFLHGMLIDLRLPDWWRVLPEPELARDGCQVILKSIGPNEKAVLEIVKTIARVRNLPMPDLSQFEVVLAELPRVAAFMLKRELKKAGAAVEIRKVTNAEFGGE